MIFGLLPSDSMRMGLGMSVGMELYEFHSREEVADFEGGGFGRVGTVRAVELNARAKRFANRAVSGFRGIGRAHRLAPFCNGSFRFKNHHHAFAGAHEFGELAEERACAMDGVEAFGFGPREAN